MTENHEQEFNKNLVSEYLKWGSVDEAFSQNDYNLPISYASYHRLLDKWGIVKAAGPNKRLSEAVCFLTLMSHNKIPLERLYKKMPHSFQTSMSTMHRIMAHVKEGIVRRYGTALVITEQNDKNQILIANDISTPKIAVDDKLGKFVGSFSLPMTFSKQNENNSQSILRVLQHEVFTQDAINRTMPRLEIDNLKPFMFIQIADIRVQVFHLKLPKHINNFSSYKLIDHQFVNSEFLINPDASLRQGIYEIIAAFTNATDYYEYKPIEVISEANFNLLQQLALESEEME